MSQRRTASSGFSGLPRWRILPPRMSLSRSLIWKCYFPKRAATIDETAAEERAMRDSGLTNFRASPAIDPPGSPKTGTAGRGRRISRDAKMKPRGRSWLQA